MSLARSQPLAAGHVFLKIDVITTPGCTRYRCRRTTHTGEKMVAHHSTRLLPISVLQGVSHETHRNFYPMTQSRSGGLCRSSGSSSPVYSPLFLSTRAFFGNATNPPSVSKHSMNSISLPSGVEPKMVVPNTTKRSPQGLLATALPKRAHRRSQSRQNPALSFRRPCSPVTLATS